MVMIYIIPPSSTFYEAKGIGLVWDILKRRQETSMILSFLKEYSES